MKLLTDIQIMYIVTNKPTNLFLFENIKTVPHLN